MHRLARNRLVNLHVHHTRTMEPKPPTTFCRPVCSSSSSDRYWAHRPDGSVRQTDLYYRARWTALFLDLVRLTRGSLPIEEK